MTYRIVAIGKLKSAEAELYARYAKRLGKSLQLVESPDSQAGTLAQKLNPKIATVALDETGQHMSTYQLHDWCKQRSYKIQFAIGGADGLPAAVREQADLVLAFGKLTWPHQIARALLVEQIYRIESIRAGHPYHRD